MNITGVNVVFYWVADIETALGFYRDALGLEPGPRYGDWQEMQLPGPTRFALHASGQPPEGINAAVSLQVDSLDEAIAELAELDHHPVAGITDTGAARFAGFADPDGNIVDLIEPA